MSYHFLPLIFITLFNLSYSQNIVTAWHYDKVLMYIHKNIQNYFENEFLETIKEISIKGKKEGDIEITEIKPTSTSLTTADSYGNLNSGLFLYTPNKLNINYDINYKNKEEAKTATMELSIYDLKININSSNAVIEIKDKDFVVYDVDKSILDTFKRLVIKAFDDNSVMTNYSEKINIVNYYKELMKQHKSFSYQSSKLLGHKNVEIPLNRYIDFCYEKDLKFENAMCYFSGELNGEESEDKKKDPLIFENFIEANDNYHMFINRKLFNDVMDYVVKENVKNIYKKGSTSIKLPYEFTSKYLKEIFDFSFEKDDASFSVEVQVKNIIFNEKDYHLLSLNNVIMLEGLSENITFSNDFNFKVDKKIIKSTKFDICVSEINVKEVKSEGTIKIKDENKIKEWINKSFNVESYPLCLSDNGITLRDYFSYLTNVTIGEKGVFIQGMHLYQ